ATRAQYPPAPVNPAPSAKEFPGGLDDGPLAIVPRASDGGGDLPAGAEGGVEAAVGVVADSGEIGVEGVLPRVACGDQLSVGLEDEGGCAVRVDPDRSADRSPRAEGRIEAAAGVVAGEAEGRLAGVPARRHQLP